MRNSEESLYHFPLLMLLFLFIAVSSNIYPQAPVSISGTVISDSLDEELYSVTDRDIYIAGETVYIKVYCHDRATHNPSDVSKVAYISLLDHLSAPLVQTKLWLSGSSGSGEMIIPDTLRTGRYLISACTHFMRNFSPGLFSGKIITVINPFIHIDHINIPALNADGDTVTFSDLNEKKSQPAGSNEASASPEKLIDIETDRTVTGPREKVKVTVTVINEEGNPVEGDFAISVIKAFTSNRMNHSEPGRVIRNINQAPDNRNEILPQAGILFLPEPEGHLVSGTLYSTVTGKPVPDENIILSFVGKTALCKFCKTDEKGAFNFIINETGRQELVIQPLNPDLTDLYVELENPFPEVFARYDPGQFFIDTTMIKELNSVIISMQVQALYRQYRDSIKKSRENETSHDFYGDPAYGINISDFIELTSIKEIFKELIPVAFIETRKANSRFVLKNCSRDEYYLTEPFVLVDGVPVNDHDAVLRTSPADMERINVLNCRYYIADICLNGIIDFKTIKGNLSGAGTEIPLFRQEFDAPLSGSDFFSPVYNTQEQKESRIPDCRNTLYWDPAITTGNNGTTTMEFYTSDEPGDYLVIVEGFTADGLFRSARSIITIVNPLREP